MPESVLIQFKSHPEERDLIGRIILAYGELEVTVMDLVNAALIGDTKTAVRTLFRLRSENNRLEVADAISRPWMISQGLEGQYQEALTAVRHCKNIRNQYAHCTWLNDNGVLRFSNLEDVAKTSGEKCDMKLTPITLAVLKEQYAYFSYAHHALVWVADQYRLKTRQPRLMEQHIPKPKRVSPPKLDSRGAAPARLLIEIGNPKPL